MLLDVSFCRVGISLRHNWGCISETTPAGSAQPGDPSIRSHGGDGHRKECVHQGAWRTQCAFGEAAKDRA